MDNCTLTPSLLFLWRGSLCSKRAVTPTANNWPRRRISGSSRTKIVALSKSQSADQRRIILPSIFDKDKGQYDIEAGFTRREYGNMSMRAMGPAFNVLLQELGHAEYGFAIPTLVHGKQVKVVSEPGRCGEYDGLVTTHENLILCVTGADCGALLLADGHNGVLGACHAGWRGALAGIVEATVDEMVTSGAAPAHIRAFIAPCISAANFEVGEEVAEQFPPEFVVRDPSWRRPHVDLKGFMKQKCMEKGILEQFIEIHPGCTVGQPEEFFSHRVDSATGHPGGRNLAFIVMRTQNS